MTAFGGMHPTVRDDTLIFSALAESYFAEVFAPREVVAFKTQRVEFKIEALRGYRLTLLSLHSSGLRSEEGQPLFSNTFAFGT